MKVAMWTKTGRIMFRPGWRWEGSHQAPHQNQQKFLGLQLQLRQRMRMGWGQLTPRPSSPSTGAKQRTEWTSLRRWSGGVVSQAGAYLGQGSPPSHHYFIHILVINVIVDFVKLEHYYYHELQAQPPHPPS